MEKFNRLLSAAWPGLILTMVTSMGTATAADTNTASGDFFGIGPALQNVSVVLIGWGHSDADLVTPRLVQDGMLASRQHRLSLLVEQPEGHLDIEGEFNGFATEAKKITGLEVIAADHPRMFESRAHYEEVAKSYTEGSIEGIMAIMSADDFVSMQDRDTHFASVIEREVGRGRKVVLFVGYGHIAGIGVLLREKGIDYFATHTEPDLVGYRVMHNGRPIGVLQRTPTIEFNRALYLQIYPEQSRLGKIREKLRIGLRGITNRVLKRCDRLFESTD